MTEIESLKHEFLATIASAEHPRDVLKDSRLKALYGKISAIPADERASFGQQLNKLKQSLKLWKSF